MIIKMEIGRPIGGMDRHSAVLPNLRANGARFLVAFVLVAWNQIFRPTAEIPPRCIAKSGEHDLVLA